MSSVDVMHFIKNHAIPAGKRRGYLRGCGGMLPTIPAGESHHPILLHGGLRFPSLCSYLELFGMTLEDPLSVFLLAQARIDRASCLRSLHSLFQGVSGHSVGTLLATFAHSSPISLVKKWRVATSFSGADTFGSHLRRFGRPYVLVAASETQDYHRAAHEANHPRLRVFARCVSEESVTRDIPSHHLRFLWFSLRFVLSAQSSGGRFGLEFEPGVIRGVFGVGSLSASSGDPAGKRDLFTRERSAVGARADRGWFA